MINPSYYDGDRHQRCRFCDPAVHVFWLVQPRSASESQGCFLLPDYTGSFRLHRKPVRLWVQRFGIGNFPQERFWFLDQSERQLDTTGANC
jgi:hypothetical protein